MFDDIVSSPSRCSSQLSSSISAKSPSQLKYQFLVDRRNREFPHLPRHTVSHHASKNSLQFNQSLPVTSLPASLYDQNRAESQRDLNHTSTLETVLQAGSRDVGTVRNGRRTSLADQSLADQSLADQSFADQSLANQSLAFQSLVDRSLADGSLADPSLADPNLADQSLANQKLADQSLANESLAYQSLVDRSFADGSLANQSLADQSLSTEVKRESYYSMHPMTKCDLRCQVRM